MDQQRAFFLGVRQFCKQAQFDAEDTATIERLLLLPEKQARPILDRVRARLTKSGSSPYDFVGTGYQTQPAGHYGQRPGHSIYETGRDVGRGIASIPGQVGGFFRGLFGAEVPQEDLPEMSPREAMEAAGMREDEIQRRLGQMSAAHTAAGRRQLSTTLGQAGLSRAVIRHMDDSMIQDVLQQRMPDVDPEDMQGVMGQVQQMRTTDQQLLDMQRRRSTALGRTTFGGSGAAGDDGTGRMQDTIKTSPSATDTGQ